MTNSKPTIRTHIKSLTPKIATLNSVNSHELITKQLLTHPAFLVAKTIATYHPLPDEVDISHFNQAAVRLGKILAYPVCRGAGEMDMFTQKDKLVRSIDLIIIPCRAFDPTTLHRLGRGGGYYDRYLARTPHAVKIIVAYELQKIPDLPTNSHDLPVDFIITESTTYHPPR
ncbi:5-formyltetrahydrofolate cyclo-ligase [Candidatus Saccharibacteria bacterium]|nr:5-formyltetrahydrofolate cyclo-ligase [Candidatus Saccharibacteria bacterium]